MEAATSPAIGKSTMRGLPGLWLVPPSLGDTSKKQQSLLSCLCLYLLPCFPATPEDSIVLLDAVWSEQCSGYQIKMTLSCRAALGWDQTVKLTIKIKCLKAEAKPAAASSASLLCSLQSW